MYTHLHICICIHTSLDENLALLLPIAVDTMHESCSLPVVMQVDVCPPLEENL